MTVAGSLSPRGRRRGLATLAVSAMAVVAASCVPLEPLPPQASQYCLTAPPSSAADYQQAFDGLRTVWTEWAAADGAFPIDLPDHRVLWLFGDTIVGRVRPNDSIAGGWKFVRNSFVLQDDRCFTPLMPGPRGARSEAVPSPSGSDWFWPTAGAVVNGGTSVRIFLLHMRYNDNPNTGIFDFEFVDIRAATFSLPSLSYQGTSVLTGLPASPDYGETVLSPGDGFLYLYGHTGVFFQSNPKHYVARVPLGQETAATPSWEYLVDATAGGTWSANAVDALPVPFDPDGTAGSEPFDAERGPLDALSVVERGPGDYVATAKPVGALSPDIVTFSAPTPFGPWSYIGQAATNLPHDLGGLFSYAGQIVTFLPGASPVLIYSWNYNPLDAVLNWTHLYKAVFSTPAPGSFE